MVKLAIIRQAVKAKAKKLQKIKTSVRNEKIERKANRLPMEMS